MPRDKEKEKETQEVSRQARWQRKQHAIGLCVLCSEPEYRSWRCKKHYEANKLRQRIAARKARAKRRKRKK